jgi:glutamate-1-semialdehyde 2,1-aminomutase
VYAELERRAATLCANPPSGITVNRVGSMFTFFFTAGPVIDWETAARSRKEDYAKFFHWMLERGVYLAPSQFEAAFLSAAHTGEDISLTLEAARSFFAQAQA